jgi:hypothetical protein
MNLPDHAVLLLHLRFATSRHFGGKLDRFEQRHPHARGDRISVKGYPHLTNTAPTRARG